MEEDRFENLRNGELINYEADRVSILPAKLISRTVILRVKNS